MFGRRSTADEVRELALMALASALQEQVKNMQRRKPRLGGVRALATGAVLYTAGRAVAPKLREQLEAQRDGDEREDAYDDEESAQDGPVAEDEQSYDEDEYEEPAAERGDEDEYEEPQAEGRDDESYDDDEYEEPQAERDDDYDEDEPDEEEQRPAPRPRRSRSPVGRA